MNNTSISWTDLSWNPMSGCQQISPGCRWCYARTLAENKRGTRAFPNGFDLTIRRHKLAEPAKVKTPSVIFVNSMSDLFWNRIPPGYRDEVMEVIANTPQHRYQMLTKRASEMVDYFSTRPVPKNLMLGVSVENQNYTSRIDSLKTIDARRFVSLEPLLGPIKYDFAGIDWCIVGGESGCHLRDPRIRKLRGLSDQKDGRWIPQTEKVSWVRWIRDACRKSGTSFYFKQWGGYRPTSAGCLLDGKEYHQRPRCYGKE